MWLPVAGYYVMVMWLVGVTSSADNSLHVSHWWDGGFEGTFRIKADREVLSWTAQIHFDHNIRLLEIWKAKIVTATDHDFELQSYDWSSRIASGQTLEVKYVARSDYVRSSDILPPQGTINIMSNYADNGGGQTTGTAAPTTTPGQTTGTAAPTTTQVQTTGTSASTTTPGQTTVSTKVIVYNSWDGGFEGKFIIYAEREVLSWKAYVHFDIHVDKLEIWKATSKPITGYDFMLRSLDWSSKIAAGQTLDVPFVVRASGFVRASGPEPSRGTVYIMFNYADNSGGSTSGQTTVPTTTSEQTDETTAPTTTSGQTDGTTAPTTTTGQPEETTPPTTTSGQPEGTTPPPTTSSTPGSPMKYRYDDAMSKSILFYDAQRSGPLPANNPIPWRGDSAVDDGDNGHDLSGGWYDAGDHVKFNFPMAYSSWVLNWGFLKFRDAYEAAGQTQKMCDTVKWPLEYFLKCWIPSSNTLYAQVGDGNTDHAYWGRAENMNMNRPAFKVDYNNPGSDVAADTASAMASGYLVFKDICNDADFADRLLQASQSLYTFAMNTDRKYSDSVPASPFYTSSGVRDEKSAAGAWMYLAIGDAGYLADAKTYHETGLPWAFSWDDKKAASKMLLYEVTGEQGYKKEVEDFVNSFMPGGQVPYTPCGLAFRNNWAANRYAANTAFIAVIAAEAGIQPVSYKTWAMSQINYILGDNPGRRSYEIGFGQNFPQRPHHRGSSCPTTTTWCDPGAAGPNPNELTGGLVGGPTQTDDYSDDRSNYQNNEVACDYNAGFQGTLAGLFHFSLKNSLPAAPAPKC